MEEAKYLAQQQQLMLQQHHHHLQQQQQQHQLQQHQHQHQQMLLLQQQIQLQQQKQHQQQASLSRLESFRRPPPQQQQPQQLIPSINPNPNLNHPLISNHLQNPNPNLSPNPNPNPSSSAVPKVMRNPAELQMAYQDLRKVCNPDYKTPFSSLEDACERLLPYHVVADYEAEEDDRILHSDNTGQMLSRAQQWDNNIAAKVAEFAETFRKQVFAFNIINHKGALGEFRMEERLLIERLLMGEESQSLVELREELQSRQNAGHEANLRMVAMVEAEQARAESQAHAEMMARGPIRPNALGFQGSNIQIGQNIANQGVNPEEMINEWGNNAQRDENEPTEDFLYDEETENGDAGKGEFDLNTR
ncbi:GLTSCR1 domain-containing protein [Heracleum sosnowskyi]|uniref:GLTSCR1 domain-containing protein n=1 Tax=Heracleum sosnowskyi TaxID=360622 RepID=A0AAD8H763_9APIA|nr:GLTSCR1 domain-containing protein [Heracleum sosnowskyi]